MREFSAPYKFSGGLRQYATSRRGEDGLTVCYNMAPNSTGLSGIEPIVNQIIDPGNLKWPIEYDWPFPQLFCLKNCNILATRLGVYILDSSFIPSIEVGVDERESIWSVADFHDYIFMTNGALNYEILVANNDLHPCSLDRYPKTGVVCNFRGQLIAGNVDGYGSNTVVWGPIGEASLSVSSADGSGFMPMNWSGEILEIKLLGEYLVIYGSGGISILKPTIDPIPTFSLFDLTKFGIAGKGAVAGDLSEHVFISETGKLWKLTARLEIAELGYQEFFSPFVGSQIMASFVDGDRDFYFSDGVSCYLLTRYGLCQTYQLVTSCHLYASERMGIFGSTGYVGANVVTDSIDYGLRAVKSIQTIELSSKWDRVGINYSLDGTSFHSSPQFNFNPQNEANIKVSGVDLRVNLQSDSFVGKNLDYMNLRWKLTDKRFIRGTYASKTTT